MLRLLFPLSFLSPPALFIGTLMLAKGTKGDPMNLELAAYGFALIIAAGLTFPRPGHPMFEFFKRMKARAEERQKVAAEQAATANTAEATELLRDFVDFNMEAAQFEETDRPHHAGWSRLDIQVGGIETPSSWIGGLPELPDDIAWPEGEGKAAVFLAQIALSDLPKNIWGGLGPKSGWLVFFVAPRDCGGATVLHIKHKGPQRPYPKASWIENFVGMNVRDMMQKSGRPLDSFQPRKWPLKVAPTQENPPDILNRFDERRAIWEAFDALDPSDPRLGAYAADENEAHYLANMRALDAYTENPDAFSPEARALYEERWAAEAEWQSATMSGPVTSEFFYAAPQEPVALLRLPCLDLVGWDFHDAAPLGIFISPRDLKRGRWHKAWYDIAV